MRRPREPMFLARQNYRRRRLEDAAKLLPVLGAFLFVLPLFVGGGSGATLGAYVFAAWLCLIVAALVIARGLSRMPPQTLPTGQGEDGWTANTGPPRDEIVDEDHL